MSAHPYILQALFQMPFQDNTYNYWNYCCCNDVCFNCNVYSELILVRWSVVLFVDAENITADEFSEEGRKKKFPLKNGELFTYKSAQHPF